MSNPICSYCGLRVAIPCETKCEELYCVEKLPLSIPNHRSDTYDCPGLEGLQQKTVYLIGSLRNPEIPKLAGELRKQGLSVFDDWHAPGPQTDEFWQSYEKHRGRSYKDALDAPHAWNVYEYDKRHLDQAYAAVLVMPAGKSGHLELGYMKGCGKRTYVLFDQEPERWDVMYRFADQVCFSTPELIAELRR